MAENKMASEVTEFLSEIGRKGGLVKSKEKAEAVRQNGKKGGRKMLKPEEMNESQKRRQERYLASKNKQSFSDL